MKSKCKSPASKLSDMMKTDQEPTAKVKPATRSRQRRPDTESTEPVPVKRSRRYVEDIPSDSDNKLINGDDDLKDKGMSKKAKPKKTQALKNGCDDTNNNRRRPNRQARSATGTPENDEEPVKKSTRKRATKRDTLDVQKEPTRNKRRSASRVKSYKEPGSDESGSDSQPESKKKTKSKSVNNEPEESNPVTKTAGRVKSYKQSLSDTDSDGSNGSQNESDVELEPKSKPKQRRNTSVVKKGNTVAKDSKPVTKLVKKPRKSTAKSVANKTNPVVKVEDVNNDEIGDPIVTSDAKVASTSQSGTSDNKVAEMDGGSSSEESADDWEEVEDLPGYSPSKKDVQITLEAPDGKKKKKGFDWAAYARRLWKRHQKKQHECTHKIELMCLLTHGKILNEICNDDFLKAFSMSLCGKTNLKGKQCTASNIVKVVKTLTNKITVERQPADKQYINTTTLLDDLEEEIQGGVVTRSDHFAVILIALLRSLGAAVRLCMAWNPTPWRITHFEKLQRQQKYKNQRKDSGSSNEEESKSKKKGKAKSKGTTLQEWSKLSSSLPIYGGATYFHWGRSSCPDKSALIYKGMITGPDLISPGGGSDLQCLPDDPEYDPAAPIGVPHSSLKPAWLQVAFSENMFGRPMTRRHIPCAACETIQRVSKIMIPAKVRCPSDSTLEYKGYLVSAAEGNLPADYFKTGHFRVNYVCMDSKIESLNSTTPDWSGTPLYPVAAHATGGGALPNIPPYKSDYTALSCVVCSK